MTKRQLLFFLAILTLMMVLILPAHAAEEVQVSLTPDRAELTVGDPIQLLLEVNHPAGYQVIIPKLEQSWGTLEVRNQSQAETLANGDGTETTRQLIEVTLFDLGEVHTPEMPLTIGDGVGGVTEALIPSTMLNVVPTLAEDDNDLRDLKPQADLNVPSVLSWIAGGLLLAAVAAVVGWWAYRRWQGKPFGSAPAVDNRPAWQVALDELARIEGLGLLELGHFKEYYTLIADTMRTYLEHQFHLRVFERTTLELRSILRHSDLEAEHIRPLLDLFAESDLVKFAKFTPDVRMALQAVVKARQLVELTRPKAGSELDAFFSEDNPTTPGQGGKRSKMEAASAGA